MLKLTHMYWFERKPQLLGPISKSLPAYSGKRIGNGYILALTSYFPFVARLKILSF